MIIRIKKKQERNRLICVRDNGSIVQEDLGPQLPFHDIAHYVVEKKLGLKKGFYGNIESGYSVAELSDKAVIRTLGEESLIAEIVTRALQSLGSGACRKEEFGQLVDAELSAMNLRPALILDDKTVTGMLEEYTGLLFEWNGLGDGQEIVLHYNP